MANIFGDEIIKLNDEKQSREELIKAIQEIDSSYKDEGQTIDEINKKRQETIDKIKEDIVIEKIKEIYPMYQNINDVDLKITRM